jgi:hypothetical protein
VTGGIKQTETASRSGATTEVKAWFGWKTSSEGDLYTEAAERERAAANATGKLKKRTSMGKPEKKFAQKEDKQLK